MLPTRSNWRDASAGNEHARRAREAASGSYQKTTQPCSGVVVCGRSARHGFIAVRNTALGFGHAWPRTFQGGCDRNCRVGGAQPRRSGVPLGSMANVHLPSWRRELRSGRPGLSGGLAPAAACRARGRGGLAPCGAQGTIALQALASRPIWRLRAPCISSHNPIGVRTTRSTAVSQLAQRSTAPIAPP